MSFHTIKGRLYNTVVILHTVQSARLIITQEILGYKWIKI